MRRTAVESEAIRSVGYDAGTRTLEVQFASGEVYRYFDVPEAEYRTLLVADSKGQCFQARIRDRYRYLRT
ncbi:MAG TPA: KTSC domain-containing protein [bacterium]|nr:KTSC domain-containing protein [bacterium]